MCFLLATAQNYAVVLSWDTEQSSSKYINGYSKKSNEEETENYLI